MVGGVEEEEAGMESDVPVGRTSPGGAASTGMNKIGSVAVAVDVMGQFEDVDMLAG